MEKRKAHSRLTNLTMLFGGAFFAFAAADLGWIEDFSSASHWFQGLMILCVGTLIVLENKGKPLANEQPVDGRD